MNNTNINGDEARILLQAMCSAGVNYPGNTLPAVVGLFSKLVQLHLNQPAAVPTKE